MPCRGIKNLHRCIIRWSVYMEYHNVQFNCNFVVLPWFYLEIYRIRGSNTHKHLCYDVPVALRPTLFLIINYFCWILDQEQYWCMCMCVLVCVRTLSSVLCNPHPNSSVSCSWLSSLFVPLCMFVYMSVHCVPPSPAAHTAAP